MQDSDTEEVVDSDTGAEMIAEERPVMRISTLSDRSSMFLGIGFLVIIVLAISVSTGVTAREKWKRDPITKTTALLKSTPLIDGHNDLPWQIRMHHGAYLEDLDLARDLSAAWAFSHTDIPRMREGLVGAQFWSAYVSCDAQDKDAVKHTMEQIDLIRRMVDKYPETFKFVTDASGITEAFEEERIASLIGVGGGHSIDSSLGTLRQLYNLGVRYLTLTGNCSTPWADAHDGPARNGGLSLFGQTVIREMNRLGMMVDISNAHFKTMDDVLFVAEAPVIFSHSAAYAVCSNTKNVPDSILSKLKTNRGIIMVNFDSEVIGCGGEATLDMVVDHIEYIRRTAGLPHVGLGAGFDGFRVAPTGLEDTSKYPDLILALMRKGWSEEHLELLVGKNFLRVFELVEEIRDRKREMGERPFEDEEILSGWSSTCRSEWSGLDL